MRRGGGYGTGTRICTTAVPFVWITSDQMANALFMMNNNTERKRYNNDRDCRKTRVKRYGSRMDNGGVQSRFGIFGSTVRVRSWI